MTAAAITAPRMPRLTAVELRKATDTRAGFWLLLLVILSALAVVAIVLAAGDPEDQTFASLFGDCVGIVSVLLPIVGLLLVTSEWSQRTALTTFTLVPERTRVVVAKLLAGCALALVAVVACLAFAALGTLISGESWSFTLSHLGQGAIYELFGMLSALALGLVIMHSAGAHRGRGRHRAARSGQVVRPEPVDRAAHRRHGPRRRLGARRRHRGDLARAAAGARNAAATPA